MITNITINNSEFIVPKRNLCIYNNPNFMALVKAALAIRDYKSPGISDDFRVKIETEYASYECIQKDLRRMERCRGWIELLYPFFEFECVLFENSPVFDLRELSFSARKFEVNLFEEMELDEDKVGIFKNFVQELDAILGENINKALVVANTEDNKYYIGCKDLETDVVCSLNEEVQLIQDKVIFACNTFKVTDDTKTVIIEDLAKPVFEMNTDTLGFNFRNKEIQFIISSNEFIAIEDALHYEHQTSVAFA